jgi:hypothetical protein
MDFAHRLPPRCIGMLWPLLVAAAQASEPVPPAAEPLITVEAAGPGLRLHPATGPGAWARDQRLRLAGEQAERSLAVSGRLGRRSRTLWQASWRGIDADGDDGSITTASVLARHRNLAARLTYRHGEARDLHALIEWSTARASSATLPNAIFRTALGLDQRLGHGAWLEWRIGQRMIPARDRVEPGFAISLRLTP